MTTLKVKPLSDDLSFGACITGVTLENVKRPEVREKIHAQFIERGVLLFKDVEATGELQLAISDIFGPLQEHAMKAISTVDNGVMPGVIDLNYNMNVFNVDGKILNAYVPWHFDACYVAHLNRGGVLRAIDIPEEGGLTGFVDGIQLYRDVAPEYIQAFEHRKILYHPKRMFQKQRFDMPSHFSVVSLQSTTVKLFEAAEDEPRSVQPAIWTRKSGERVLHVCAWQADGIYGEEGPKGDAELEGLFKEINAKMKPYWHKWGPNDMLAWDNWRMLHAVSGNDPKYQRRMHRTTIKGDYGLGAFENEIQRESSYAFEA